MDHAQASHCLSVDGNNNVEMLNWTADFLPNDNSGVVGFTFDAYDHGKPLVLLIGAIPFDIPTETPGVCYATYLGGNNSDAILANTIDENGNHYITGTTYSTFAYFPGDVGTNYFMGSPSLYACRINDLDHIVWKDYFGGSGADQFPYGIAVRSGGDPKVYVGGRTSCSNFYCYDAPGPDYFDPTGGSYNGFIVRFDHDAGVMEHSTYFGNGIESTEVHDITIDPLGRLIAVGMTVGNLPTHQVPLPAGAEQWSYGGSSDCFIAVFNLNDQLLWSTPFGGSSEDYAQTVRAVGNKIVVVGSGGSSGNFPQALYGGGDQNSNTTAGSSDLIIMEFNLNGDQQWGTLFGGNAIEIPGLHGLDIDPVTGDIYIVGYTSSTDLQQVYSTDWHDPTTPQSGYNGFIAEFSNDRNRRWVTYANSAGGTELNSVRISQEREIFIGGYAGMDFPCVPAIDLYSTNALLGSRDGVIMRFDVMHNYVWGTYFGGDVSEKIYSIALKGNERLYAGGATNSPFGPGNFFSIVR